MRRGQGRMPHRSVSVLLLGALAGASGLLACSEPRDETPPPAPAPADEAPPPTSAESATATISENDDAGAVGAEGEEPEYDGPFLGALFMQTPVMSGMAWPLKDGEERRPDREYAVRIGYIRQGGKVPVIAEPHVKENCKEGWYELVQGGFVCGRYATVDLSHPKIRLGPHAPYTDGMLPYEYGYNVTNGTPLYRTVPSREERLKLEPWLAPKPKPKPKPAEEEGVAYGDEAFDAGAPLQLASAIQAADPFGVSSDALDAGTPWYLRQHDGGKPSVTLDDLRGEGPVSRRMVKGFFISIDSEMKANNAKWWKTTGGLIAPQDRVRPHTAVSEFHGVWLDEQGLPIGDAEGAPPRRVIENFGRPGSKGQLAVITGFKPKKYQVTESRKAVVAGDPAERRTVVRLTGDSVLINGARYEETDEGWWMKHNEGTKASTEPPKDLKPGEKWIDVNIKTQMLVAFEGDRPVFVTLVSTGKEDKDDPEKDHKTPTGTWRIREKHIAATMDGDVTSDGPYSIEDVPWIMYFNGSYAVHGAFWHNSFGRTRSHGCVNLAPTDAKALFGWSEPQVPRGWHAVWSTPERPGTRVVVHE
jgi:lipoprotein-anchoring transpeptidase ErfK/SrfK